jgi:hypothetical protein
VPRYLEMTAVREDARTAKIQIASRVSRVLLCLIGVKPKVRYFVSWKDFFSPFATTGFLLDSLLLAKDLFIPAMHGRMRAAVVARNNSDILPAFIADGRIGFALTRNCPDVFRLAGIALLDSPWT